MSHTEVGHFRASRLKGYTLYKKGLDPIFVVFHDIESGKGRILIECYGWAWSAYFGAMGDRKIEDFVISANIDCLHTALINGQRSTSKSEREYLMKILKVVKQDLEHLT